MSVNVKTNQPALMALQHLNMTNDRMGQTQTRVNTGLMIASAKDNAAIYAIAQDQRASISALGAVTDSLNRATSIADVASAAGQTISDLLNSMKEKVLAAMAPDLAPASRALLNTDYVGLLREISQVVQNASFDGANILDGSLTGGLRFIANADANAFVTLSVHDMSLGGPVVALPAASTIGTAADAATVLGLLDSSIVNVNSALADIAAQAKQIASHNNFVAKLADSLTIGVGDLVDADMAAESARLQALQVQQQLGTQALSIANQAPQMILQLFK